jgi:TPR repeat protein
VKWYLKAAQQGLASAQFNLGNMYNNGHGVTQDYAEAVKWYRKAAEQGDAAAQNTLGNMYQKGQGVVQDYIQAHKWLNLAAARGKGKNREESVEVRDLVASQMTPADISEAQHLAHEWTPDEKCP